MGAKSRRKGARGELESCDVVRPIFPDVRRKAMQARGGREGADLENTPGFHIEVGIGRVNPRAKWEQATEDTQGPVPIALTRKDRGEWLVTMRASEWVETVARLRAYENPTDVVYLMPRAFTGGKK